MFTYRAEDTFWPLTSNIATGTITVSCVNDLPVANNDATATGTEDVPFLIDVTANDTDVDNSIVSITGLTQPNTGATLTLSGLDILATPDAEFCTSTPETFTYRVRDASGATSNVATGSFIISCVNDNPIAVNDTDATMRNTPVLVTVLSNDTDLDHANTDLSINSVSTGSLGSPTISGTGILFTPTAGLCGTGTFTYRAEDASGATSNIATGTVTISCSNSAPTATNDSLTVAEDASATSLDIIANDNDVDLGDTLSISTIVSSTSNGLLSVISATEVEYTPDAEYCGVDVFTYRAEDTNSGALSNIATGTITVTCIPPPAPTVLAVEWDTTFALLISDSTPTLTGTGKPLSILSIYSSTGVLLATGTVTLSGTFSITIPQSLIDGTHTFDVTVTDNVISESLPTPVTFTIDTTPPTLPIISSFASPNNTGALTLSGTTSPDAELTITDASGAILCTTTATSTGYYSCGPLTPAPLDGTHLLTLTVCDDATPTNCANTGTTLTVDTVPPATPTLTSLGGDTTLPYRTSDTTPSLIGSGEADTIVSIYSSTGVLIATGMVNASGTYNISLPTILPEGTYSLDITLTDLAGNESLPTPATFTIDTTPPGVPTYSSFASPNNTGALILSGTTTPDAILEITDASGTILCSTTATATGYYSCGPLSPALGDGIHVLTLIVCDDATPVNCANTGTTLTVDTILPTAPTIVSIGTDTTAPYRTSDTTPTLIGSGEAGTIITLYSATGVIILTGTVNASGSYSLIYPTSLPEGNYTGSLTLTDLAGNESLPTPVTFTIDTTPPTLPIISSFASPNNTGALTLSGTTSPDAELTITDASGAILCTTTATSTGYYSCGPLTPAPLDGTHLLTLTVCDDATPTNCANTGTTLTVDTVPPATPTLTSLGGDTTLPYRTSDTTPSLIGSGEADTIVSIYSSTGVLIATGMVNASGTYNISLPTILPEGTYSLDITLTDLAGNESLPTPATFTIDTTPPGVPTLAPFHNPVSTGSVTFTGITDIGSILDISVVSGSTLCTTSPNASGVYTCGPLIPPPLDGVYTLIVRACDNATLPNCSFYTGSVLIVENPSNNIIQDTAGSSSNGNSASSSPSVSPASTPNVAPGVFPPKFSFVDPTLVLNSPPNIFDNNFLKILPTQTYVNLDSTLREGYQVYTLSERVTDYVCPQLVQVYSLGDLKTQDIPSGDFTDDIKALIMFRGLETNEKIIGQTFSDSQQFGVALNADKFEPYRPVTRAEFVKMLVRSLSCRYSFVGTDSKFPDIEKSMWYAEYITFAVKNGWISGYSDGTFRPNAAITRAEAAKILARAIKLKIPPRTTSSFVDVPKTSVFVPYIETLRINKIIEGKTISTFEPNANIVRTEASRIIYKTFLGWWKK